jgi:hypothetical protein
LNVYTIEGMIFQATPITAAMFFLLTVGAFSALNSEMEEAALLCGATRLTILRTIVVPIMAPALTGAAILSVIRGMENFETPFLLGNPGGVFVLSTEIYRYLRLDTPPEPGNAGALSLAILAAAQPRPDEVFCLCEGALRSAVTLRSRDEISAARSLPAVLRPARLPTPCRVCRRFAGLARAACRWGMLRRIPWPGRSEGSNST